MARFLAVAPAAIAGLGPSSQIKFAMFVLFDFLLAVRPAHSKLNALVSYLSYATLTACQRTRPRGLNLKKLRN